MVLMTHLPFEVTELIFKFFCGLILVSIVKVLLFRKAAKSTQFSSNKQENKVSTFHFQSSLPRLPVPKLADTCRSYLTVQESLLTPQMFERTRILTEEFLKEGSEGWKLNERLMKMHQANKHSNYVSDYLREYKYLRSRFPLFYSNSFGVFADDPRNPSQIDRAAHIVYYATQFYTEMRDETLEPYIFCLRKKKKNNKLFNLLKFIPHSLACHGAYLMDIIPLDMSMVRNMFGTTRIPRQIKDEISKTENSSHIVVLKDCHFYSIQVLESNGSQVDIQTIFTALEAINSDRRLPPAHPVTYLSSFERSKCAQSREELLSDERNRELMSIIDSALFLVCLDDCQPQDENDICRVFLHNNGHNRWYEKTLQFFVTKNGISGLNFEHSVLTGGVCLPLFEYIYNKSTKTPHPLTTPTKTTPRESLVQKLDFNVSEKLKIIIEQGRIETQKVTANFFFYCHHHTKLNKNYIKSKKLSPDGLVQVGFHVAYYRQYGELPSLSEACRTSAFAGGRTETARPMSQHVLNVARAMDKSSGISVEEKISLLYKAVSWHSDQLRQAATGKGFDRHLFALKCLSLSEGITLPFFEDPGYHKYSTVDIGTTTLPTLTAMTGGLGPFNLNAFALLYFIYDHTIDIYLTNHSTRDGSKFMSQISQVLNELHELLEASH